MFLKSSIVFALYTLLSRIFGLVRDLLVASHFGASLYADAFNVAFKLPNFFRSIFAEGAFSSAFVPLFSGKVVKDEQKNALEFASNVLMILSLTVLILVAILEIAMPFVITILAPGFEEDQMKFDLTIYLTRITTPYLIFITLVTFFSCVLSAFGKFASQAASPIILNLCMIIALYYFSGDSRLTAINLAWSVAIGGVLQLLVIYYSIYKKKIQIKISFPKFTPEIKRLLSNMTPAVIGSGISQINLWIGTIIATTIPGAVSLIYYADRITQLPLALLGVSIGIVILPTLSKYIKTGEIERYVYTQNRAIEIALLFSLPCLVALLIISKPIIYILFQRGEFNSGDTIATTAALVTLGLGIPAYVLNKIMIPLFFAHEDTKTPVRISTFCVVVSLASNLLLIDSLKHVAITLTTSIVAWINVGMLFYYAIKKGLFYFDDIFKTKILRLLLCSAIMYIYLHGIAGIAADYLYASSRTYNVLSLLLVIFSAMIVYLIALMSTNTYSVSELRNLYHAKH